MSTGRGRGWRWRGIYMASTGGGITTTRPGVDGQGRGVRKAHHWRRGGGAGATMGRSRGGSCKKIMGGGRGEGGWRERGVDRRE
jgi:hypothetical protein